MNERKKMFKINALVLTELIVVIIIFALMISLVTINFSGMLVRRQFEQQANDFIDIIRKAVTASAESGKRYAIMLDIEEQTYVLKEIIEPYFVNIQDDFETPAMHTGYFTKQCRLDYVRYDDEKETDSRDPMEGDVYLEVQSFYTSRAGFDNGGIIVLRDDEGNAYSIILNRLTRTVELKVGEDYEIAKPIDKDELRF